MGLIYDFTGKTLVQHVRERLHSLWYPSAVPADRPDQLFGWRLLIVLYAALNLSIRIIPEDVLTRYPDLVPFTDFMAQWIPAIDRATELGLMPELNRFVYSFLWAFMGFLGLIYAVVLHIYHRRGLIKLTAGRALSAPILGLLFVSPIYWLWPFTFHDRIDWQTRIFFGTHGGIASFATLMVGVAVLATVISLMTIKGLVTGEVIERKDKGADR